MPVTSPSHRSVIASIAAHERWAREPDRVAALAPARQAIEDRFLAAARVLHPKLSEDEIRVRAANLRSAQAKRAALARWTQEKAPAPAHGTSAREVDRVSDPTPTD